MRGRWGGRSLRAWLLVSVLAVVSVACSDDLEVVLPGQSIGRQAAGEDVSPDLNEFCRAANFTWVRDITLCFVLRNETSKFVGPDVLGGKFPLTVPRGDCEKLYAADICNETGGYFGSIRSEDLGSRYGRRVLTPENFTSIGAIQFQPDEIWQGVTTRLYVGSKTPPFTLDQPMAQPYFSLPTASANSGDCTAQGEFIACELLSGTWTDRELNARPQYRFTTKPWRIQIGNTTKHPMLLLSQSAGAGFLPDPVAMSNLQAIPAGNGTAFIGGYKAVSGSGDQSYSASYCLDTSKLAEDLVPGAAPPAPSLADCVRIELRFSIGRDATGKAVNQSTCNVVNPSRTVVFKCPVPTLDPDATLASAVIS